MFREDSSDKRSRNLEVPIISCFLEFKTRSHLIVVQHGSLVKYHNIIMSFLFTVKYSKSSKYFSYNIVH